MLANPAHGEIESCPVLAPVAQIRFFDTSRKLCRKFAPFRVTAFERHQEFIAVRPLPRGEPQPDVYPQSKPRQSPAGTLFCRRLSLPGSEFEMRSFQIADPERVVVDSAPPEILPQQFVLHDVAGMQRHARFRAAKGEGWISMQIQPYVPELMRQQCIFIASPSSGQCHVQQNEKEPAFHPLIVDGQSMRQRELLEKRGVVEVALEDLDSGNVRGQPYLTVDRVREDPYSDEPPIARRLDFRFPLRKRR